VTEQQWNHIKCWDCALDLSVSVELDYRAAAPCTVLMHIMPVDDAHQSINSQSFSVESGQIRGHVSGENGIGLRHWIDVKTRLHCKMQTNVSVTRQRVELGRLNATPLHEIPADVVGYLMSSHYCSANAFGDFLTQFGAQKGGVLAASLMDWCQSNLTYDNTASNGFTTALETFEARRGVCRDFAHLLISFCRASAIPARYASVYSPDVLPPDFHAVVEIFLDGAWHLIDPTGMTTADRIVRIGVGRDATDVSFLTSYGDIYINYQSVDVSSFVK
jgi:hypothetical protein